MYLVSASSRALFSLYTVYILPAWSTKSFETHFIANFLPLYSVKCTSPYAPLPRTLSFLKSSTLSTSLVRKVEYSEDRPTDTTESLSNVVKVLLSLIDLRTNSSSTYSWVRFLSPEKYSYASRDSCVCVTFRDG